MAKRNRRRKHDKRTRVDLEKLPEKLAEGITTGPESNLEATNKIAAVMRGESTEMPVAFQEADERFPKLPGAVDLSYMLQQTDGPKFVARNAAEPVGAWNFGDERYFRDTDILFTREDRLKIERGYMCLRCFEPQSAMNADDHLPGCPGVDMYGERYMRDGHMMIEVAAEFVGVEYIGPSVPLAQHVARQDERNKKLKWIRDQVQRGNQEAAVRAYNELVRDAQTDAS